jgi:hypothetical protein
MISLLNILNEWKISSPSKPEIKKIKILNAPLLNLKIGKWDIDKGQKGFKYSWDEAVDDKLISTPTKNKVLNICNKLGITAPESVYFGWYVHEYETPEKRVIINNKSTYVLAYYKNEPIIMAQRQTHDPAVGQFYVFSKYAKSGKAARIGNDESTLFIDKNATKEQILDFLKIKDDNTGETVTENQTKIEVKNPDYYKQLVDQTAFSSSTKKYYYKLIQAVKDKGNKATPNQYYTLKQIERGKS